jgi:uncharacterized membrane protein
VIANLLAAALILAVQLRFGLLALATCSIVFGASNFTPTTLQSFWYAGYGYAVQLLIVALAFYGFRTSLGGRVLLNFSDMDKEASPGR